MPRKKKVTNTANTRLRYFLIPKTEDIPVEKGMEFFRTLDVRIIGEEITRETLETLVRENGNQKLIDSGLMSVASDYFLKDGRRIAIRREE